MLKEQQVVAQQLERSLTDANEALEATRCQLQEAVCAEQDASTMAATLTGDHLSRRELIDELQERLRGAESGRRVAEASWREAEDARQDAQHARREAERNWHQVCATGRHAAQLLDNVATLLVCSLDIVYFQLVPGLGLLCGCVA